MYILHRNLGGFTPLGTQMIHWMIMRWGQQDPGTHQLPYMLEKLCHPLLPHPINLWMYAMLPHFSGLWPHSPQLVIFLCLLFSFPFPPHLCPPYCLHPKFWTLACLHLSDGLEFDIGRLLHSSVQPGYPR